MRIRVLGLSLGLAFTLFAGCGGSDPSPEPSNGGLGNGGSAGSAGGSATEFGTGDANGHAEPFGAKAAGQARAGKVTSESMIFQPENARQKVRVGDFVLANDRIAVYVEDVGDSDGYGRFGGEILAVDRVDDAGKPLGLSQYGETLIGPGMQVVKARNVSVINDGSDGKAAVVRAVGVFTHPPFLGALSGIFPNDYTYEGAIEYVLEPGEPRVKIRIGMYNADEEATLVKTDNFAGFFHSHRSKLYTGEFGFGKAKQDLKFVGYINGGSNFAIRPPGGQTMGYGIAQSGFVLFVFPPMKWEAKEKKWFDYGEIVVGGPNLDGLLANIRELDGDTSWRTINGSVKASDGAGKAGSYVHVFDGSGKAINRTIAKADGSFSINVPAGASTLRATHDGYAPTPAVAITDASNSADLVFASSGKLHVKATDAGSSEAMPVRIQIIPTAPPERLASDTGVQYESRDRLYQEFAMSGEATLDVPPGEHRVIVTHGYEYEMYDSKVMVADGQQVDLDVPLAHSVDSAGIAQMQLKYFA